MQNYNHIKIYELAKSTEKVKTNNNKENNFLKRMLDDIHKRQNKDKRINNLIEQTKIKADEGEVIKTFNRLIEDANRRMEAFDNMDMMKQFLDDKIAFKKYSENEWKRVYQERFIIY